MNRWWFYCIALFLQYFKMHSFIKNIESSFWMKYLHVNMFAFRFMVTANYMFVLVCVCLIHCVSSGVRNRRNFANAVLEWAPLVVVIRYSVFVIGDFIGSSWGMRDKFNDPPYLTSRCFVNPLYIFLSLSLSLRALISCSSMHVMYAFVSDRCFRVKHVVGKLCDGIWLAFWKTTYSFV